VNNPEQQEHFDQLVEKLMRIYPGCTISHNLTGNWVNKETLKMDTEPVEKIELYYNSDPTKDWLLFRYIYEWACNTQQIEIGYKLNDVPKNIPTKEFKKTIPLRVMVLATYLGAALSPPSFLLLPYM
jgi:hypothetical protein